MLKFLHISTKECTINSRTFKKPDLTEQDHRHSLNPNGCLFLSKAYEDGTSDWLNYSKSYANGSVWVTGYEKGIGYCHYFDIDMTSHKDHVAHLTNVGIGFFPWDFLKNRFASLRDAA